MTTNAPCSALAPSRSPASVITILDISWTSGTSATKAKGDSSDNGILEQPVIILKNQTPDAIQIEIQASRCRKPEMQTKGLKNAKEEYSKFTMMEIGADLKIGTSPKGVLEREAAALCSQLKK